MPTVSAGASALVRGVFSATANVSAVTRGTFHATAGVTTVVVGGMPAQVQVYGRKDRLADHQRHLIRANGRLVGTYVRWTPAIRCSCALEGGQVMTTCRVCRGWGWWWPDEEERLIGGDLTQATVHRDYQVMGLLMPGDIVFVPERNAHFGVQDRFRVARPDLHHLKIRAEAELVVRAQYGATDDLPYRVTELLHVTRTNPHTGEINRYRPGYDVTAAGYTLTWDALLPAPTHPDSTAPPPGTRYSVDFLADYDWLVVEPTSPRAISNVALGSKVLLRKRHRRVQMDTPAPFDPEVR